MTKTVSLIGIILSFILVHQTSMAFSGGCEIMPADAIQLSDKLIRAFHEKSQQDDSQARFLPDNLPINSEINQDYNADTGEAIHQIRYEAILRPKKTDFFHLFHLILFKLERTRNLMYVCLNVNSQRPEESHLTIYFMLAYGLEPSSIDRDNLSTLPGDWLFGPGGLFNGKSSSVSQITRVPVELVPLHLLTNDVSDWAANIPVVEEIFKVPGTVLKFSGALLARINEKLGVGVERIKVTKDAIEFANSVDVNHPEKRNVIYRIDLAKQGIRVF